MNRVVNFVCLFAALAMDITLLGSGAQADDKLLDETVEFTRLGFRER